MSVSVSVSVRSQKKNAIMMRERQWQADESESKSCVHFLFFALAHHLCLPPLVNVATHNSYGCLERLLLVQRTQSNFVRVAQLDFCERKQQFTFLCVKLFHIHGECVLLLHKNTDTKTSQQHPFIHKWQKGKISIGIGTN